MLFRALRLTRHDVDHGWLRDKFQKLCKDLGTKVEDDDGKQGYIVVKISEAKEQTT